MKFLLLNRSIEVQIPNNFTYLAASDPTVQKTSSGKPLQPKTQTVMRFHDTILNLDSTRK